MARDWNQQIIGEFRANGGRVGGRFEGPPLLLLHHRGARSGKVRVRPLVYRALEGGALAVFASKGGAPRNPDWYHNVRANPEVEVEVAGRRIRARARVAEGEERERSGGRRRARFLPSAPIRRGPGGRSRS